MPCAHCATGQRHPQFVLLLVDKRCIGDNHALSKDAVAVWDYTRQPHARMQQHNRLDRFKKGPKKTKAGAPHYILLMSFGPFKSCAYTFFKAMDSKVVSKSSIQEQILCACALSVSWHEEIEPGHCKLHTFVEDAYAPVLKKVLDQPATPTTVLSVITRAVSHAKHALRALYRRRLREVCTSRANEQLIQ